MARRAPRTERIVDDLPDSTCRSSSHQAPRNTRTLNLLAQAQSSPMTSAQSNMSDELMIVDTQWARVVRLVSTSMKMYLQVLSRLRDIRFPRLHQLTLHTEGSSIHHASPHRSPVKTFDEFCESERLGHAPAPSYASQCNAAGGSVMGRDVDPTITSLQVGHGLCIPRDGKWRGISRSRAKASWILDKLALERQGDDVDPSKSPGNNKEHRSRAKK